MNDRIKEIEQQCWQSTQSEPYALFDVKKFALLLIEECAGICMQEFDTGLLMAPQAPWIAKQIKEHFGVEE
jgi:hypothetical protein